MLSTLADRCRKLSRQTIMKMTRISQSQLYEWEKEIRDRKPRASKELDEETVLNAVQVMNRFPHLGGRKGQTFMLYHNLGLIAQHVYNTLKKIVKRLIRQEVSSRKLLPPGTPYEHERPRAVHEIWAEDFGQIAVSGRWYYIGLVMDVYSLSYLGVEVTEFPGNDLVRGPIVKALNRSGGRVPERFLLSDNGRQYVSNDHEELLDVHAIVHRLIPSCRPEYNGTMEGGVKEFKHVMYAVLSKKTMGADKEKNPLAVVAEIASETQFLLNRVIPRPKLGGVTPSDVLAGRQAVERRRLETIREAELEREPHPLTKPLWQSVREFLNMSEATNRELLFNYYHTVRKPLRNITRYQLTCEGVGKFP